MVQICGCRFNHIFFTLKSQIYIYAPNSVIQVEAELLLELEC